MDFKILEPDGFSERAIESLSQLGSVEFSGEVTQCQDSTQAMFVRLRYQLDAKFLSQFPRLKYLISPTTGEDHIDKDFLEKQGITLISLKGEIEFLRSIPATAEFTWGLLLSLSRNIISAHNSAIRDSWNRDLHKGIDLRGKMLGLVGMGRVASIVTRYAHAFGMKVSYFDPYVEPTDSSVQRYLSLEEMFSQADIVSLHPALTAETRNLVSRKELDCLQRHALLLNTARGDVLDNSALLELLKSGDIAGAALDVLPEERVIENHLRSELVDYAERNTNLVLTPHLAGATQESMAMTEEFVVSKLLSLIGRA